MRRPRTYGGQVRRPQPGVDLSLCGLSRSGADAPRRESGAAPLRRCRACVRLAARRAHVAHGLSSRPAKAARCSGDIATIRAISRSCPTSTRAAIRARCAANVARSAASSSVCACSCARRAAASRRSCRRSLRKFGTRATKSSRSAARSSRDRASVNGPRPISVIPPRDPPRPPSNIAPTSVPAPEDSLSATRSAASASSAAHAPGPPGPKRFRPAFPARALSSVCPSSLILRHQGRREIC